MSLESEMKKAEIKEYNQDTDNYDFGTGTIGIDDAIKIAKANPLDADVREKIAELIPTTEAIQTYISDKYNLSTAVDVKGLNFKFYCEALNGAKYVIDMIKSNFTA